jgi:class 3 adenylate cyclase
MVDEDRLRDLRLYASYSPAQVVLRYSAGEDPEPPSSPETYRFPAAIGFVDVSGFTALSEKLSKEHGRKGAELLNQ